MTLGAPPARRTRLGRSYAVNFDEIGQFLAEPIQRIQENAKNGRLHLASRLLLAVMTASNVSPGWRRYLQMEGREELRQQTIDEQRAALEQAGRDRTASDDRYRSTAVKT
jgi:hypothetical protein